MYLKNKKKSITVRLTNTQYELVTELAYKNKTSKAEVIRYLITKAKGDSNNGNK